MINRIYGTSDETPRVLIKVKEIPQSGKMAHIKKKKSSSQIVQQL